MKKVFKWLGIGFLVLVVITAITGAGKSPTTNTGKQPANQQASAKEEPTTAVAEEVVASEFIGAFDKNQLKAEQQYKDKRIKMTAYINNISEDIVGSPFLSLQPTAEQYYFGTTAKCNFKSKDELTSVEKKQQITVEGTVTSQDLGIIGLKDCQIVQ